MKTRKTLMRGLVALLMAAPMVHAQFTWNGTSNLSGTQTYDGLDVDSGLDPYTFGSTSANSYIGFGDTGVLNVHSGSLTWINGNPNIGRSSGGNGTVNVDAGAFLTINNNGTWGSSIGHAGATGVLNIGDGASMMWILSGSNEQRLMVGNGSSAHGTINLNGGSMTVSNDVAEALDDNDRGFRVGSDGGTGTLNLNGGTFTIGASSFALGGGWTGMNSTPTFNEGGFGTLNIHDGNLVFNGSSLIGFGSQADINFTSWGLGSVSLMGWGESNYLALASSGKLTIDGVVQSDLSNFMFITEGSQGVLSAIDVVPSTPAVPTGISASVISSNITVSWTSEFGTTYKIYRSTTSGSGYTQVGSEYASPFQDTLPANTTYYYVITASRTDSGESAYSDEVTASSTPPAAPTVRKIWMNGTTAKLYWNEAAGATNYTVYQSETSGTNYVPVAAADALEYWVTNLTEGVTYYFAIAGVNGNGPGDLSPELSGTVTNFSIISDGGGTWKNSIYTLPEAVFDGDTATTYDGNNAGAWVGIDLGEGRMRSCPAVDFYPRSGNAARMSGAQFQGSNDGSSWDTIATVSGTPAYDWSRLYTGSTNAYRYFRCYGAQFGNVAEIRFLSVDDVPDVLYSPSPADGATMVPVASNIVVTTTDISTHLVDNLDYATMTLNSNEVLSFSITFPNGIDGGVVAFILATNLSYETDYTVQLNVYRSDGVTNTVNFSFTTELNTADYLIAPGVRNGGFELVDGTNTYTADMNDWSRIDSWDSVPSQQNAKTRYGTGATEGNRYLDTARNSINYNLTDHVVQQGDILDFQFTMSPDRQAGAIVGLCYSNAVSGVTNIAASEVTVPDLWGGGYERVESGTYVVGAGDPAIGHRIGLMIKDNGNNPTNDTSITEAHVDNIRLRLGDLAIQSVSPADGATGVASKPAIQVVVAEGLDQVDTETIVLTVDGGGVAPDTVVDSSTNVVITYTPASPLSVANHTVSVEVSGMNGKTVSKTWSFEVAAGGTPSSPTIGSFTVGAGTVGLSWDSEPGVDYYIVSTTNLVTGPWGTNLIITGTGSSISTNLQGGAKAAEYFRLEAQ